MDHRRGLQILFFRTGRQGRAAENQIFFCKVDVHPRAGAQVPDEMDFTRGYHKKIPTPEVKQRIVQKDPAGPFSDDIEFVVIVKMIFRHLIFCTSGHAVGVDPVYVQV